MKVLHVLYSKIFTGAETVVAQIIRSFREDPNVEMLYCSRESSVVADILAQQGISYVPVQDLTPRELGKVIKEQKPDVIHAHDMRASFVAALCCGKIPLVCHIHNNAMDAHGLSVKSVAFLLAAMKAKHILWVSQSAYDGYCFHKLFSKKSSVLYNIIDKAALLEKKALDENSYDFDVIYVGRLTYPKDPVRLMEVCARMKEKKPDLKVALVGDGDLEEETRKRCRELGLEDNVRFLGFQPNPIKMVSDSRLLVLISHWEGTPMCVLEAMALGTPVVSIPSDGLKVLIDPGKSGYLCGTDEEFADSMLKIIEDPDHRAFLGENGKKKFAQLCDEERYKETVALCYGLR